MNKRILLTMLLALIVIFSVSAISASEVNVTDSYATSLVDDTTDASVPMENTADSSVLSVSDVDNDPSKVSLSSEEVLESENSNTLSTNSNNDVISSDNGVAVLKASSNVSSTVDVSKSVTAKDITKYYKGSTKYAATFYDSQGKSLTSTNVKITVNGVTYTQKTDSKGVASLSINLKPGTYKVVAANPKTGYKLTTTFKILSTITASDVSKVYSDGRVFKATFLKSNGKALANKNIKFKINGKTYTKKTNSKGVATLTMYNLKVGTYKMISYNTDGLTKTNTVKVVKSTTSSLTTSTYTFLKSDSKTIKVKLLNGFGYAPGSGKVIKITINGKTYSSKTNSNGVASLKLPTLKAGTYTVKYKFAGNSFYKASSASNKVYILPSKTPTFTVKSTTTFGKGAGTAFKLAVTSGSVPLVGKTITIKLNGNTYTKTTDSSGIVSVPINLATGKYTVSYSIAKTSKTNAKSASSSITVKDRTTSTLTWKSGNSFYQGAQTYKILLSANGKALASKSVKLTVNSKSYTATTSSSGLATFNVNVAVGNQTVSYSFAGDNDYAPSSGSAKISVAKKDTTGYGYWLYGEDMKSVDLNSLASQGTSDIFLNYYAITKHGQSTVETWIASANKLGIRVHIWMQAFYSGSTGWVNPVKNGKVDSDYFAKKVSEAQKYASVKGVSGIHLDYLRYPGTAYKTTGGTAAINEFVKQVTEAVHAINPTILVSAALMPETSSNAYYYGQDLSVLGQYLDIVIPMVYKGNYGKTSTWITTTAKWFVTNSQGAQVWVGLQGYNSDSDVTKLSASAIKTDAQAALSSTASGVVIFRWGTTNFVDFTKLSDTSATPTTTGSVSISDILTAATALNKTISTSGSVPATVSVGGVSYSASQFMYMMAKAIEYINAGKTSTQVLPVSASAPSNPSSTAKAGNLTLKEYVDLATRVSSFISNNGHAPNYANSSLGNIQYQSIADAFSRILAFYKTHSRLPSYVGIDVDVKASQSSTTAKTISVKNIITGAKNLNTYYNNNKVLPNTVTAGGITFTLPEFLYLMSQAIYQLGNSNTKDITYLTGVSAPKSPTGSNINTDLSQANYLTVAKNVANYITTNKQAPNYASSAAGNIIYSELVDAFSRILTFYNTNSRLPSTVAISYSSGSTSSSSQSGTGLNEKNTETDLSKYLKATTNCEVGNSAIKKLVTSLTSGLTSDSAKATAIYNYVRDNLAYSFYYDTKYGAAGTLSAKKGNCVDHSHLLVAMFRTAGLAARYAHGTCTFTSGSVYGHVWVQVLVNGKWTVADATSSKNSLGKVSNWNTNTFKLKGIYSSLSF